ncbi:unnamed protein product [Linum trigynum]|uniref:Uncharacterized protein n=1 Tax=Linum trigynum TaxID=586398 RepID=A0AAV2DRL7_9ROSI
MKEKNTNLFPLLLLLLSFVSLSLVNSSSDAKIPPAISSHGTLTQAEVSYLRRRQLLYYKDEFGDRGENVTIPPGFVFENPRPPPPPLFSPPPPPNHYYTANSPKISQSGSENLSER